MAKREWTPAQRKKFMATQKAKRLARQRQEHPDALPEAPSRSLAEVREMVQRGEFRMKEEILVMFLNIVRRIIQ